MKLCGVFRRLYSNLPEEHDHYSSIFCFNLKRDPIYTRISHKCVKTRKKKETFFGLSMRSKLLHFGSGSHLENNNVLRIRVKGREHMQRGGCTSAKGVMRLLQEFPLSRK